MTVGNEVVLSEVAKGEIDTRSFEDLANVVSDCNGAKVDNVVSVNGNGNMCHDPDGLCCLNGDKGVIIDDPGSGVDNSDLESKHRVVSSENHSDLESKPRVDTSDLEKAVVKEGRDVHLLAENEDGGVSLLENKDDILSGESNGEVVGLETTCIVEQSDENSVKEPECHDPDANHLLNIDTRDVGSGDSGVESLETTDVLDQPNKNFVKVPECHDPDAYHLLNNVNREVGGGDSGVEPLETTGILEQPDGSSVKEPEYHDPDTYHLLNSDTFEVGSGDSGVESLETTGVLEQPDGNSVKEPECHDPDAYHLLNSDTIGSGDPDVESKHSVITSDLEVQNEEVVVNDGLDVPSFAEDGDPSIGYESGGEVVDLGTTDTIEQPNRNGDPESLFRLNDDTRSVIIDYMNNSDEEFKPEVDSEVTSYLEVQSAEAVLINGQNVQSSAEDEDSSVLLSTLKFDMLDVKPKGKVVDLETTGTVEQQPDGNAVDEHEDGQGGCEVVSRVEKGSSSNLISNITDEELRLGVSQGSVILSANTGSSCDESAQLGEMQESVIMTVVDNRSEVKQEVVHSVNSQPVLAQEFEVVNLVNNELVCSPNVEDDDENERGNILVESSGSFFHSPDVPAHDQSLSADQDNVASGLVDGHEADQVVLQTETTAGPFSDEKKISQISPELSEIPKSAVGNGERTADHFSESLRNAPAGSGSMYEIKLTKESCTKDDNGIDHISSHAGSSYSLDTNIQFGSFGSASVAYTPPSNNVLTKSQVANGGADCSNHKNFPNGGTKPFQFLVKFPRFDDKKHQDKIKDAQQLLGEKTRERNALQHQIQMKKAEVEILLRNRETARKLFELKKKEINSVQFIMNRIKSAMTIADIDSWIVSMAHRIEHETLPLKEEKMLIREIKHQKKARDELFYDTGSNEEIQEALDQRDHIEGRQKILRMELDYLKVELIKAEEDYKKENKELNSMRNKCTKAVQVRNDAYNDLVELKEKNNYFWSYKTNANEASNCARHGDKEALNRICLDQVESAMEVWNKNDEFRKEYVRCNMRSTLRRLKTFDGRSVGPDEEAPVLPIDDERRVDRLLSVPCKATSSTLVSTQEQERLVPDVKGDVAGVKSIEMAEPTNGILKSKRSVQPITGSEPTSSTKVDSEETEEKQNSQTQEDLELERKAEIARKEETDAKLKEQHRLVEKAKAHEAIERKRRKAEQAQIRAELRARKEAEQKEKEREKRLRKKENKKSVVAADNHSNIDEESAPAPQLQIESMKQSASKESVATVTKPQKATHYSKQSKAKAIPPPLRTRSKRRWREVLGWISVIAIVVLLIFIIFGGH